MQDMPRARTAGGAAGADPAAPRAIGRTRAMVSTLGFGSAPFGSVDAGMRADVAARAFAAARAARLRYFDTAPLYGYGLAERRLGTCIDTVDRRELTLSTKVGRLLRPAATAASAGVHAGEHPFAYTYDYGYDATLRSLEFSLQRLGTNRVDIVLIHDVNRRWQGERIEERYAEAMSGAYRALHDLRAQGVIDAIGVGVNDWEILLRFAADGDFDCFMLAGRYTLLDHTAGARFMPECARRGIAVLMAAPFNSGILATGAVPGATYFYQGADAAIVERTRRIAAVCGRHGVALPAAALQFPLGHPAVASVVTGMRSAEEVAQNVKHMRAPIPPDCWRELVHDGLLDAAVPLPGTG